MRRFLITATFAVLVLMAAVLPAQDGPAPYLTIHYDRIDPSHMTEFEKNSQEWVEAFTEAEAGEDYYWRGYQSGFTYAWVSDLGSYAELDEREALEAKLAEKMGEDKMKALVAGGGDAIIEHHTEVWKYQSEMSYMPEGFDFSKMGAASVAIVNVKPSKGQQYREVVGEAVAAMKELGAEDVNFVGYSMPFGQGSYAFVSWATDRGALHSRRDMGELLNEAVGAEKSQDMFTRYLGSVESETERDWRPRSELSYAGAMGGEEDTE